MTIKKKVQLYVSEATGNSKNAKYYKVFLPCEVQPYDILDNPLKGLVRLYCRIIGDRIEFAPVVRHTPIGLSVPVPQSIVLDDGVTYVTYAEECNPDIPKELLNDGESYSGYMNLAMDDTNDRIQFDTVKFFSNNNLTIPEGTEHAIEELKYLGDNKSKLFAKGRPIYSDTYSDLTQFVPDTWEEFDSYDAVLEDIRRWVDGTDVVADRCPDYPKSMVNSKRLKNIIKEVCSISGDRVDGEVKSGETVVESSAASEGYAKYMERIKLENPTLQGDTLTIECRNYCIRSEEARAKLSVFGKKANGDIVEFPDTHEAVSEGQELLYKATVTNVSEFTEILFHLYSRKSGSGQSVNTRVKFTV